MNIGYLQRKAAWEILLKVSSGDFSDHALEKVLKNYQFNPLDIAFITELSFGCIRYRKFLDLWTDHTAKISRPILSDYLIFPLTFYRDFSLTLPDDIAS